MTTAEERAREALETGDEAAVLQILMEAYGDQIYRYCWYQLGDAECAKDAMQTTFVKAYESLHSFEQRSTFRQWLYGIARHRCLDAIRVERRRQERHVEIDRLPEPGADGAVHLERQLLLRRVEELLFRLDPNERAALLLRYREGFTYPEMAVLCDATPAALERRVARALVKLRKLVSRGGRP